jgi:hypothetical protein
LHIFSTLGEKKQNIFLEFDILAAKTMLGGLNFLPEYFNQIVSLTFRDGVVLTRNTIIWVKIRYTSLINNTIVCNLVSQE